MEDSLELGLELLSVLGSFRFFFLQCSRCTVLLHSHWHCGVVCFGGAFVKLTTWGGGIGGQLFAWLLGAKGCIGGGCGACGTCGCVTRTLYLRSRVASRAPLRRWSFVSSLVGGFHVQHKKGVISANSLL